MNPEDGEENLALGLLEHLATVNDLEAIADDDSQLLAWGQNLASRAYALQIALRYLKTHARPQLSAKSFLSTVYLLGI